MGCSNSDDVILLCPVPRVCSMLTLNSQFDQEAGHQLLQCGRLITLCSVVHHFWFSSERERNRDTEKQKPSHGQSPGISWLDTDFDWNGVLLRNQETGPSTGLLLMIYIPNVTNLLHVCTPPCFSVLTDTQEWNEMCHDSLEVQQAAVLTLTYMIHADSARCTCSRGLAFDDRRDQLSRFPCVKPSLALTYVGIVPTIWLPGSHGLFTWFGLYGPVRTLACQFLVWPSPMGIIRMPLSRPLYCVWRERRNQHTVSWPVSNTLLMFFARCCSVVLWHGCVLISDNSVRFSVIDVKFEDTSITR